MVLLPYRFQSILHQEWDVNNCIPDTSDNEMNVHVAIEAFSFESPPLSKALHRRRGGSRPLH